MVLGLEPRVLCMLGKHSSIVLQAQPQSILLLHAFQKTDIIILTMTGYPHFLLIYAQISHCPLGQGWLPIVLYPKQQRQMASLLALFSGCLLSAGLFIHLLIVCLSLFLPSSYLLACLTLTYLCIYFFDFLDPLAHYRCSVVISVINQNLGLNSPYSVSQTRITEQCCYPRHCGAIQRAGLCWTWKGWDFLKRPRNISMEIPTHRGIKRSQLLLRPSKVSGRGFTCPGGEQVAFTVPSLFVYQFILFPLASWVYSPSDQAPRAWPWEATTQSLTPLGIEQCDWSMGQKVRGQGWEPGR